MEEIEVKADDKQEKITNLMTIDNIKEILGTTKGVVLMKR